MADFQYLNQTGVIVADTSDILTETQDEYKEAFGSDLVVTSDTPQGVLITAEALARAEVVNNNAALANQINPNIAGGVFLDAIMALTGMERTAATPTTVSSVTMTGVAGTVISAGSIAATEEGDQFETITAVTLNSSGMATVDFQSVELGPIACAASALSRVVSNVLGWETVINTNAGTLGQATQSDQQARALRQNTLAFQGVSLAEAITSALYNVEGVSSLTFQENTSASTQVINGITMVAHSIYACVDGGTDEDVAAALLENKSSGCAWNGDTVVDVVEPASNQTYQVQFDRPEQVSILIRVTTPNGNESNIIQSILNYADGEVQITNQNGVENALAGFVVGADVSPFEIAGAIMAENPGYYITKVEVSLVSPVSYTTDNIAIGVDEIAYTQSSYISVIVT